MMHVLVRENKEHYVFFNHDTNKTHNFKPHKVRNDQDFLRFTPLTQSRQDGNVFSIQQISQPLVAFLYCFVAQNLLLTND